MKRVARAFPLKLIAVILCIAASGFTVQILMSTFLKTEFIYLFEDQFQNSYRVADRFTSTVNWIDAYARNVVVNNADPVQAQQNLTRHLQADGEDMEYYAVDKKGGVWTNIPAGEQGTLQTGRAWAAYEDGEVRQFPENKNMHLRQYIQGDSIQTLYLRMDDEAYTQMEQEWTAAKAKTDEALWQLGILFLAGLLAFIYLLWVAGRQPVDEEIHMLLIDRMYVELDLGFLAAILAGLTAMFFCILEPIFLGGTLPSLIYGLAAAAAAGGTGLCLLFTLALVRNMKNRSFVKRSLIVTVIRFCWNLAARIIRWGWNWVKKILGWGVSGLKKVWQILKETKDTIWNSVFKNYKTRNVILLFAAYSGALFILAVMFGVMIDYSEGILAFLCAVVLLGVAVTFLIKRIEGFESIRQGIAKIRGGELEYKITDCPAGVMQVIAEDMNYIGEGLAKSLENEIKAERMKSELITNVSHDLKTPLTSIINYADLLCQEELKPEEANDYAAIIKQKSQRLKNLTADLFDISKVQSGTETIQREKIDMTLLLKQTLAEFDSNIQASKFQLHTSLPEREVYILADGKKLSRVFENLIGNCLKYTLENTRIYLSLKAEGGQVQAEIKNIANYAMDFDEEEITERFVRGDAARSTEGSGLGLAIAKSYVEAMGGRLIIRRDGDLFKVIVTFPIKDA